MPRGDFRPIFVYGDAISALPGGTLFWFQRCDFRTDENPFLLSTAAQNIHVFLRKSPLLKEHFFEWLKTANFSTACGTVTLKSPLSQAFFLPDVHPRPRKRLARCTLDCGFKTSESPALRGFVGGLRALATAALYLVLKSNGLPRPKIRLKKFGFSIKAVPANIVQKLPSQRCSKPLFIAFFNFSHKCPTFAFVGESGYTRHPSPEPRTQRLTRRNRWRFGWGWYHYPRSVSHGSETLRGRVSERRTLPLLGLGRGCSQRTQRAFGTAMRLCASLFRGVAAPLGCVIFSVSVEIAACMPCAQGLSVCARRGVVSLPSARFTCC